MGRFDTHGGYFSPQGYLRINEGGSHGENPNGGVQLGIDGQGIPNMLEENEPVYDDFVYSDNIRADAEMLKKHHIPEKFSGKLFSEIADSFVDEAAERPNDPVSNNGLNAMLVRLADAQEEQKQVQQQRELEKELAKMSPEELDELERMLARQDAAQGQQMSPEETAMMQGAGQQVPVMANGGFIRRFDGGTPGAVVSEDGLLPEGTTMPFNVNPETGSVDGGTLMRVNPETGELMDDIEPSRVVAFPGKSQAWVDAEVGPRSIRKKISEGTGQFVRDAYDVAREASLPFYAVPGIGQALAAGDAVHGIATGDYGETALAALPFLPKIGKGATAFDRKVMTALSEAPGGSGEAGTSAGKAGKKMKPVVKKVLRGLGITAGIDAAGAAAWKAYDIWGDAPSNDVKPEYQIDSDLNDYARGGLMRRYDWGGWQPGVLPGAIFETIPQPEPAESVAAPAPSAAPATPAQVSGAAADSGRWLGDDDWKRGQLYGYYLPPDFDNGRLDVPIPYSPEGYAEVQKEQEAAISAVAGTSPVPVARRQTAIQVPAAPVQRQDLLAGFPAASPFSLPASASRMSQPGLAQPASVTVPEAGSASVQAGSGAAASAGRTRGSLGTLPRYAGMLMNGAMGLYNAFQKPDRYSVPSYRPTLPAGRMSFIDPVYNPVDEERALNAVLAQNAGDRRAVMNAGIGPSAGATLLASGYNAGKNIGAARLETSAANNDRRNAVISQRNANSAQQAQFQSQLAAQRAQIMNQAQLQNMQNGLMIQRLNNAAEGEKYQALSGNIAAMSRDLAGLGRENFAMNQIASNPYYQYAVAPDGSVVFAPKDAAHGCGGFIKKYRR